MPLAVVVCTAGCGGCVRVLLPPPPQGPCCIAREKGGTGYCFWEKGLFFLCKGTVRPFLGRLCGHHTWYTTHGTRQHPVRERRKRRRKERKGSETIDTHTSYTEDTLMGNFLSLCGVEEKKEIRCSSGFLAFPNCEWCVCAMLCSSFFLY